MYEYLLVEHVTFLGNLILAFVFLGATLPIAATITGADDSLAYGFLVAPLPAIVFAIAGTYHSFVLGIVLAGATEFAVIGRAYGLDAHEARQLALAHFAVLGVLFVGTQLFVEHAMF